LKAGKIHFVEGHDDVAAPDPSQKRFTYADFLLFPDDGKRHEIIEGVHYASPSPNLRHQELVGRLHIAIALHLRTHASAGRVFVSLLDVVFSNWDVVEPDLLFVSADQLSILTEQNVQGAPALVIEILSKTTRKRDEQVKLRLFERANVREYWIVDPERDGVKVFRRTGDGRFPEVQSLAAASDDVLTTPLLPGFSLALAELFARE
jgi:Uma2 family endonuclease